MCAGSDRWDSRVPPWTKCLNKSLCWTGVPPTDPRETSDWVPGENKDIGADMGMVGWVLATLGVACTPVVDVGIPMDVYCGWVLVAGL